MKEKYSTAISEAIKEILDHNGIYYAFDENEGTFTMHEDIMGLKLMFNIRISIKNAGFVFSFCLPTPQSFRNCKTPEDRRNHLVFAQHAEDYIKSENDSIDCGRFSFYENYNGPDEIRYNIYMPCFKDEFPDGRTLLRLFADCLITNYKRTYWLEQFAVQEKETSAHAAIGNWLNDKNMNSISDAIQHILSINHIKYSFNKEKEAFEIHEMIDNLSGEINIRILPKIDSYELDLYYSVDIDPKIAFYQDRMDVLKKSFRYLKKRYNNDRICSFENDRVQKEIRFKTIVDYKGEAAPPAVSLLRSISSPLLALAEEWDDIDRLMHSENIRFENGVMCW